VCPVAAAAAAAVNDDIVQSPVLAVVTFHAPG